ncbi:unnamed protein product [Echinostoma caproni]|uniref:KASH domain-containing protein n=1 Tax=Echinostoma caproni TaxID=27848 RepID=A0A183AIC4_9TREM|nr:unnamed protein product [Echinostoma caproni]
MDPLHFVQHFRQQRTHLGDRLRELIVNAGGGETGDRLQDLLSLQMVWHETNDKLDRRGEHMALLEQQLTTAELAIADFLKNPTDAQSMHCSKLLKHLEETYGWKLTADHERLQRRTSGRPHASQMMPTADATETGWSFDQNQLGKYEHHLKMVSRFLNEIQVDLDECKCGLSEGLKPLLEKLEARFIESYQILSAAAETLNQLTLGGGGGGGSEGSRTKGGELNTEELVWLKVLLDTQKSRIDIYSMEFKANREHWYARADQWSKFCNDLQLLKDSIVKLNAANKSSGIHANNTELKEQLRLACGQFAALNELASVLIATEADRIKHLGLTGITPPPYGTPNETGIPKSPVSTDPTTPPAVPPRKNSLHRGRALISGEHEQNLIQTELSAMRSHLQELCRNLRCPDWSSEHVSVRSEMPIHSQTPGGTGSIKDSSQQQSSYVNVNWPEDSVPPMAHSALESLGNYRGEVEACLHGLSEENRWFAEESGLVPTSLLKRKSDDILLASAANRTKPTTPAELRLDNRFWLGSATTTDGTGLIESTPSWLKSKWAELEVTCEKSALLKLFFFLFFVEKSNFAPNYALKFTQTP